MADATLFQAEIDPELAARIATQRDRWRVTNATIAREALEAFCKKLEQRRSPFEKDTEAAAE